MNVDNATPRIVSALCARLGLKQALLSFQDFPLLPRRRSCILLVTVQPLPWHRIHSLAFFLAAVWQPIVEELLFRGCLQGFLSIREGGQRSWIGISIANLLTSLVFAGAHIATDSLLWASLTLFPSLLFGVFAIGLVLSSLLSHCISIYNAGYFSSDV